MGYFLCFLLSVTLSSSKLIFTGEESRNIRAVEGRNSTLPCSKAPELELSVLQWTRSDLDKRLLVFRGAVLVGYEDSLYRDRVELLDPQLQNKDLSVVLKKVTMKDSGTYRCEAVYGDDEEVQEISQLIRLIVTEHERDCEKTLEQDKEEVFLLCLLIIPFIALFVFVQKQSKEQFVPREPPSSEQPKEHPALCSNSPSSSLASSASTAALLQNYPSPTLKPPPYSWSPPSSSVSVTSTPSWSCPFTVI